MRKEYKTPEIERVSLVPEEAVLNNCKCVGVISPGPPLGWCSGYEYVSCSSVGS